MKKPSLIRYANAAVARRHNKKIVVQERPDADGVIVQLFSVYPKGKRKFSKRDIFAKEIRGMRMTEFPLSREAAEMLCETLEAHLNRSITYVHNSTP